MLKLLQRHKTTKTCKIKTQTTTTSTTKCPQKIQKTRKTHKTNTETEANKEGTNHNTEKQHRHRDATGLVSVSDRDSSGSGSHRESPGSVSRGHRAISADQRRQQAAGRRLPPAMFVCQQTKRKPLERQMKSRGDEEKQEESPKDSLPSGCRFMI